MPTFSKTRGVAGGGRARELLENENWLANNNKNRRFENPQLDVPPPEVVLSFFLLFFREKSNVCALLLHLLARGGVYRYKRTGGKKRNIWLLKPASIPPRSGPQKFCRYTRYPPPNSQQSDVPLGVRLVVPSATNELVDVLGISRASNRFVTQGFGAAGINRSPK